MLIYGAYWKPREFYNAVISEISFDKIVQDDLHNFSDGNYYGVKL